MTDSERLVKAALALDMPHREVALALLAKRGNREAPYELALLCEKKKEKEDWIRAKERRGEIRERSAN